jgi:hypothetical protein
MSARAGRVACCFACGVILVMLGVNSASAACLQANTDDQVAQGNLKYVKIIDEVYARTEHAYILELTTPVCLDGIDEMDKVEKSTRIHVFSLEAPLLQRLHRLVGKNVVVHGNPFGEHTAHHHAPIVMRISKIDLL